MPISSNHPTPTFGAITIQDAYFNSRQGPARFNQNLKSFPNTTAGLKVLLTDQDKALGKGLPVTQTPEGDEIFIRCAEYPLMDRSMFTHVARGPIGQFIQRHILPKYQLNERTVELPKEPLKKLVAALQKPETQKDPEVDGKSAFLALNLFAHFLRG